MTATIKTPKTFFENFRKKVKKTHIAAFAATFAVGFAAHMYRMTNWLPNWDSLVFRDDPQYMAPLGRWFLSVAAKISTDYELPWLCGILSLFYIGLAAVIVCEIFDIRSRLSATLIGGITVSFPTVISSFTYCYASDAYSLSFLLACAAAYLLTRRSVKNAVCASILLALSLGIYQAYVTVTVELLTCALVLGLLTGADSVKSSLLKALKYLVAGAFAFAIYYGVQKAAVAFFDVKLLDYQGLSDTFAFANVDIKTAIGNCLYVFKNHFVDFSGGFNVYSALNIAVFSLLAVGYIAALVKNFRTVGGTVLTVLYALTIPFGSLALFFADKNLDYHMLMRMGLFIVYVYLVMIYEKFRSDTRASCVKSWSVLVLACALVFDFVCVANVAYHKLGMAFEKSYGTLLRIADRIEKADGYDTAEKILTVGYLPDSEAYSVNFPPEITGTTDGLIIRHDDEVVVQSVLASALGDYCGISLDFVHGEEAEKMKSSDTVRNMPCFPREGSVVIKDGLVIVKLGEESAGE